MVEAVSSNPLVNSKNTFTLSDDFISTYKRRKPPFGFNGLGELVYLRTYSRLKADGNNERWWETVRRVVEGTYSMQKRWIRANHSGWDDEQAQRSAEEMYDRMWNMKFLPPGRGLWAMGSPLTEERGLFAALLNCAFVSTDTIAKDLSESFCFLMDASMLGIGVGFDTKGAGQLTIHAPIVKNYNNTGDLPNLYQIPDTREGWVESVRLILDSYFKPNQLEVWPLYEAVRPAGRPIKGFGGVSAGPEPLQELHNAIKGIFDKCVGKAITATNIVDVMNLIGKCVVAGNVRRCLPKGTLVHTNTGLVPIEQIRPGMLVKTSDGFAPVSELVAQGEQSVWAVRTQLGDFHCTARHRMAVMTDVGEYEWRRAKDLQAGDRLVFVEGGVDGTPTQLPSWSYSRPKHSTTCKDITVPPLDAGAAWLLGLIQGDGYVAAYHAANGFNAHVGIATCDAYPELRVRAATELQRYGVHVSIIAHVGEACARVNAQSKQLAWYLDEHLKRPNEPLRVPSYIMQGMREIRAAFVAGLFDADGTRKSRPLVAAASVYMEYLRDIQAVLASLGIPSRVGLHRPAKGTWQALYHLNIVGERAIQLFEKIVVPYSSKYGSISSDRRRSGYDYGFPSSWVAETVEYGGAWDPTATQMVVATAVRCGVDIKGLIPISVIEVVPDVSLVDTYDITVPGANEFVCQEGLLVHNTAEIVFGDATSEEYLNLKNYAKNPHRKAYGWTSNNSVFAELGMDYEPAAQRVRDNGEPGFAWLQNMRAYSRMGDRPDNKDKRVAGGNPCLEQSLESYEACCLVETFPARHESLDDFQRTLKFAFLYAKTVTLAPTPWAKTNKVQMRNRRIGCSMSGVVQAIAKIGIGEFRKWCEDGYKTIQSWDEIYSEWFAVPRSVKITSIKPSGTVSLLAGATPGMHFPEARTYVRRVRLSRYSELVEPLQAAGYVLEPAVGSEETTLVVTIPVKIREQIRTVHEVSMWEQLSLAAFLQRYWADNQVSCTVSFNPDTEGSQIVHALNHFQFQLKGVSFLPRLAQGAYAQMPYEEITDAEYERLSAQLQPVSFRHVANEEADVERFCDGSSCTLPVSA